MQKSGGQKKSMVYFKRSQEGHCGWKGKEDGERPEIII